MDLRPPAGKLAALDMLGIHVTAGLVAQTAGWSVSASLPCPYLAMSSALREFRERSPTWKTHNPIVGSARIHRSVCAGLF
ncbi:hypothetical protein P168DRAFT_291660 [Aspergillus campestris IBT 28561]|uniref:Uncharacterized protein n=1 Tax=Aspergillus campestris (strain IBT 28561) TaxID=1392248 RepID=A0A2I1CY15_ASPC2|nr:uncharacterized protein P168DRAFT_291660 [Aspergillus campestris IBT 28561]PKY02516.1 hypothetical protein P168DRAFT_291660 [Aspergillus campestris IBT 28561]